MRDGVTVCIAAHPSRFHSGLLQRALASVTAQTHVPESVVVVNDSARSGAGWTRQQLLQLVETRWIAWIDSDDEWEAEHLAKLMLVANSADDIVFVFSWFHGHDPLGHFGLPFNPCTPHHTTMGHMVRTDIAKEVGFPDSEVGPYSNEDWAFITGVSKLACERGLKMIHLAERTWTYHQGHGNSSGQPGQGDA
jgi:glycosyltransferase involved in cell wall biosynthesis